MKSKAIFLLWRTINILLDQARYPHRARVQE